MVIAMQSTPSHGRSTPIAPSGPRASSRPRVTPAHKGLTRSPPLTTSLNSNVNGEGAHQHFLSPKEGGVKLRIKSPMTAEARTRVGGAAGTGTGMRPLGPRTTGLNSTPSVPSVLSTGMTNEMRGVTPSHSGGSLAEAWVPAPAPNFRVTNRVPEYEETLDVSETVLVSVRVRPPNDAERCRDAMNVWNTPSYDHHLIKLAKGRDGCRDDREWIFDRILEPESDNARAYATSARAHVRSAMEGFNAVIFAYGQTASGKTFTLTGSPSNPGIIPLSIADLFAQIRSTPDREFLLRASYLELYNESILDLLSPGVSRELSLSEGKKKGEVVVNGLTECAVRTEEEVRRLLRMGEDRRKVGGTDWNQRSSRSHCVFRIVIESRAAGVHSPEEIGRTPASRAKPSEKTTRISTLSIIDLAGSEKHTSSKERNAEGKHINQSLLTLKLVISKLADMASKRNVTHIPYRDSKLTRLLQPSLSGDALISVICTVSPSALNLAESLSTLSFAQGLKRVTLKAQRKEVVDPQALIQQYQNEIAELKALLREKEVGGVQESFTSKGERSKNEAMELRLNELKSLILTSVNVKTGTEGEHGEARPLSPTKLKYPKLDYDKSTAELQEDLHAAQLTMAGQENEISALKSELDARAMDPDKRILELQREVGGLKMIAADYERHLREPSRKVREDVEKEWSGRVSKLESQLESKRIWANRLDENVRALTAENREMRERCIEAETKVLQIMEWVNAALSDDPEDDFDFDGDGQGDEPPRSSLLPTLVLEQDHQVGGDDFAPAQPSGTNKKSTITLTASKMTRAQLSQMDLASFNDRFGSMGMSGRGTSIAMSMGMNGGHGHGMLREESGFDLAAQAEEEDEY